MHGLFGEPVWQRTYRNIRRKVPPLQQSRSENQSCHRSAVEGRRKADYPAHVREGPAIGESVGPADHGPGTAPRRNDEAEGEVHTPGTRCEQTSDTPDRAIDR